MPLDLTYYYNGLFPYFKLEGNVTIEEVKELFTILEDLLIRKKPFVFVMDTTGIKTTPSAIICGCHALDWLRRNSSRIPNVLLASAVVSNDDTVTNLLNWIFKQKEKVSPNMVTADKVEAIEFVKIKLPKNIIEIKSK